MKETLKTQKDIDKNTRRYKKLLNKKYTLKDLCIGTIKERYTKCGSPSCECSLGIGHGPYWFLTFSSITEHKMISRHLSNDETPLYQEKIRNFQELRADIEELLILEMKIKKQGKNKED